MTPSFNTLVCAAENKKAEDILALDLRGLASWTDICILMTARSKRHAQTLADAIEDALRQTGDKPFGIEGLENGQWVLMDYVDMVVHIFQEPARRFYDLESLWGDAPKITLPAPGTSPGSSSSTSPRSRAESGA